MPVRSFELHFPAAQRSFLVYGAFGSNSRTKNGQERTTDVVYEQRSPRF